MAEQGEPIHVFISYAPEDDASLQALEKHLKGLQRAQLIKTWHARKIGAGSEWKGQIDAWIESARIILLLVSHDFIASDYCFDVEVKRAMEKHEAGTATVLPVLLRPCDWETAPFAKLLPRDARPVSQWPDPAEAFAAVAREIRALVEGREPSAAPSARPSPPPGLRTDDRAAAPFERILPFVDQHRAGPVGAAILAFAALVALFVYSPFGAVVAVAILILVAAIVLPRLFGSRAAAAKVSATPAQYAWVLMLILPVSAAATVAALAPLAEAPRPPPLAASGATGKDGSVTTQADGEGAEAADGAGSEPAAVETAARAGHARTPTAGTAPCSYRVSTGKVDYTCAGGIVMSIDGSVDAFGNVSVYAKKPGGGSFYAGEFYVWVFDPNDGDPSSHCKQFDVQKAHATVVSPMYRIVFPPLPSQLTCGGPPKGYCVTKAAPGDNAWFCSDELVVSYR